MSELDIFFPIPENRRNADDMGMPPPVRNHRRIRCEGCDQNYADPPSKLCPGCQAYRDHQS